MRGKLKALIVTSLTAACLTSVFFAAKAADNASATDVAAKEIYLDIDYGEYDGDIPVGKVGMSYPVFGYIAEDDNGNAVTDVSVYAYDPEGNALPVKDDRFSTATAGEYQIKYVAVKGELSATETVTITVDDDLKPFSYAVNEEIPDTAFTGTLVKFPFGTITGGVGNVKPEYSLTFGDEKAEVEFNDGGMYFVPQKSGTYTYSVTATDFVGDIATAEKTVTITDGLNPVLTKPTVPKTAVVGKTVKLPYASGTLYRGDEVLRLPVKVFFDDDEVTSEMAFSATETGEHTVRYVCENPYETNAKAEYEFKVSVYAAGEGELLYDSYFYFNNFRAVSNAYSDYYAIETINNGSASVAFANPIPVEFLDVAISADEGECNYSTMRLVLTDSKNADDRVEVRLKKLYKYEGGFYAKYDDAKRILVGADGSEIAKLTTYADGRKFDGFTSGMAYVSAEIEGSRGKTKIVLTTLGNTYIAPAEADFVEPAFIYGEDYRAVRVVYKGESFSLAEVKAFDLIDGYADVKVTVTAPNKKIVYSGELDTNKTFKASGYGLYTIVYRAEDESGNYAEKTCSVYVRDITSPKISVSTPASKVKVGQTVTLPNMSATDNLTSKDKLQTYVYVLYGNNRRELVKDGAFTFEKVGTYVIRYVAYDEWQNYSVVEFTVICEEDK